MKMTIYVNNYHMIDILVIHDILMYITFS